MDRGLKFSLILHGAFVLMIIIGLPSFHRDLDLLTPIPVELMSAAEMAEQSSAPIKKVQDTKKPEPPKEQPKPKPKPKPVEEKPEPAPPQEEVKPEPAPEPEPEPEPPKEQPKPEPKPEPAPTPEPKPEAIKIPEKKPEPPKKEEPPKPEPKPKDKKEPKKTDKKAEPKKKKEDPKPKNALSSILKNLKKEVDSTPADPDDVNDLKDTESSPISSNNVSDVLTQDELSALRRQISGCWNVPAGSKDAKDLVIEVRVWTNTDRTVSKAEIVDSGRMARDPSFRTAAESALRAVRHPSCSPLMLPRNKYDQWKVFTFVFNPQDML
jgi:hypothetical protein